MKQRIELNMHSNYSKMNGVNSAREIVEHASALGMEAIAFTDIGSVKALPQAYKYAKKEGIKLILGMEAFYKNGRIYCEVEDEEDYSRIIFLVKNEVGRKNLYKLISAYYQNGYAELESREGLFVCTNGICSDVIRKLGRCDDENKIIETMKFYDFILVDPLDAEEDVKKIIALSKEAETLVIASNSPYYLKEEDAIARQVLLYSKGKDPEMFEDLSLFTTEKMLAAFEYLGEQAEEVVIDNAYKLMEQIEDVRPIPPGSYYPDLPKGAYAELEQRVYGKAKEMYGETLPELVKTRLETELGFLHRNEEWSALPFWVATKLADDSKAKGFPTVSRTYVGSSLLAFCLGLTQTNPMPAHYRCEHCHHTEFAPGFASGFDLPAKKCPHCGKDMVRDGHNIPYETLFAYDGDKEPYLDLNFCPSYYNEGVELLKTLFGRNKVINAGLSYVIRKETAKPLVRRFAEEYYEGGLLEEQQEDICEKCDGAIIKTNVYNVDYYIIPNGMEVEDYTPVEYAEDYEGNRVAVTHFDHREIGDALFEVALIPHNAPEMLRRLEEKTGAKPTENDIADNAAILEAIEAGNTGGILEMDTDYVRANFAHTKPQKFSDYVTLNGLFHGTDTYEDNAKELIANKTCALGEVIDFRESVFQYLDRKRLEYEAKTGKAAPLSHLDCYRISEAVRKGKLKRFLPEYENALKEIGVPDWYLESAKKILYLFPKAHAVEYMITAFKQLWYKLHFTKEFEETVQEIEKAYEEEKPMKKLHDVLFEEYKRIFVDEEPHTLITGDEEADKCAFFEKGKLSAFFSFNASLCWDVYRKLFEFAKGISEKSEKKVVVFTTCSLSEFMRGSLAGELHESIEEELTEEQRVRLVEAMKGYKGRNLYIENGCFTTEEIIRFLDSRDDIEAAYIARYEDFCTAPPENNMARAKEDFLSFNRLANCAERNNISIFLQTDYDDLYTYNTSVYANFEVRGELAQNKLVNVVTCDFVEDEYQKLKFTHIETIPRYPEYIFRVGDDFKY